MLEDAPETAAGLLQPVRVVKRRTSPRRERACGGGIGRGVSEGDIVSPELEVRINALGV